MHWGRAKYFILPWGEFSCFFCYFFVCVCVCVCVCVFVCVVVPADELQTT